MIKRIIDIVLSSLILIVTLPVSLVVAVLIFVAMGRPIFYRHLRPGRSEVPFQLIKFRTMNTGNGSDAERLTSVGRFLRRSSLDELPELWNVLIGEMSLVGPRPLFMRYLPYFSDEERRRHDIRPGITGLAQVSGRNYLNWDDRLAMDVHYVDNHTLALDLTILFKTISTVLRRKDVAEDTSISMKDLDDERKSRSEYTAAEAGRCT